MTKAYRPPMSAKLGPVDFLCNTRPTLHTNDLVASVCEYVDVFGFSIAQHIPHTAALLKRNDLRVQLVQRYKQYESASASAAAARAPRNCQMAVDGIFELYTNMATRVRHKLLGAPKLNVLGCWEFAMTDSQGNMLCFVQNVVNDVFSLSAAPKWVR